jgi:glutamine synthetase
LPTNLAEALDALRADAIITTAFGAQFIDYFARIKQSELLRWEQSDDKDEFQRREYFGRF